MRIINDTPTREDIVQEFHEAFGHPVGEELPKDFSDEAMRHLSQIYTLRVQLLAEEMYEIETASTKENLLKELADLQYVLSGFAVAFGLPLDEAFRRVHESNMSKLGEDGKPIYREDGKILKGPNYQPPYLADLV